MAQQTPSYHQPHPRVLEWTSYNPEVKTDLTAHAWAHQEKVVLIDPIPTSPEIDRILEKMGRVVAVFLTNANHERNTPDLRKQKPVPVAASAYAVKELSFKPDIIVDGEKTIQGLHPIALPGAGLGEHAYYDPLLRFLFVGDAIVNLPPDGPVPLPDKYCTDPVALKQSLTTLREYELDGIGFAHGPWLSEHPKQALTALLQRS